MSEVWQVFSKDDAGLKVTCSICKKKYANPGSSTTNMWNHLKFKHKPKCIELDRIRMGLSGSAFNQDVFNVTIDEDE